MKKAILATKIGMTQIFAEDGELIPVTVLQAGPCEVTQVKTVENDGYSCLLYTSWRDFGLDIDRNMFKMLQKADENRIRVSYTDASILYVTEKVKK